MSRLRAAAAVAVLGAAAAWGARTAAPPAAPRPAVVPRATAGGPGVVPVPVAGTAPVAGTPWFLTIGDSITFGYTRDRDLAGTNISWALIVERQLAAQGHPWRLFDTACPGETTTSYAVRCSGRRQVPFLLHESQRQVALDAIAAHRADLRAVVVALGANDLLHALGADPAATRAALVGHLEAILVELRAAAPGVPIVVAGVYDPFAETAPRTDAELIPIDAAVAALAARLGDAYADFHTAINRPPDGARLCSLVDCADLDIHPTPLGQERLAEAVMAGLASAPAVAVPVPGAAQPGGVAG